MLIYSTKEENHADHVLRILKQLHKQRLQVDIDKCKFSTKKVKYFGMIVTTDRIEMDSEKVEVIQR